MMIILFEINNNKKKHVSLQVTNRTVFLSKYTLSLLSYLEG